MDSWDWWTICLGGVSTLAIFSFLIKENPFYRLFEHVFIGIAAGYLPVVTIKTFLWPQIIEPIMGLNMEVFPDGTVSNPYNPLMLLYLIPFVFGLLYYFIYIPRLSWMARLVIGFSLGASAGLGIQGFFAEVIPQVISSFKPIFVRNENGFDLFSSLNHILFVSVLLSVMFYFIFTLRRESTASRLISLNGRVFMMICFGAFFGSTVMARLALLVERVQFLVRDWVVLFVR